MTKQRDDETHDLDQPFDADHETASEHAAFGEDTAQNWEDEPAPTDDYEDPQVEEAEIVEENDDEVEDEPARKSRGGWALPVILALALVGGGGYAYMQFGRHTAVSPIDAVTNEEAQRSADATAPSPIPPPPADDAPQAAPASPVAAAPLDQLPVRDTTATGLPVQPLAATDTLPTPPATLPAGPQISDVQMPSLTGMPDHAPLPDVAPLPSPPKLVEAAPLPRDTSLAAPVPVVSAKSEAELARVKTQAAADRAALANAEDDKRSLQKQVAELKRTVADLQAGMSRSQKDLAQKDAALKDAAKARKDSAAESKLAATAAKPDHAEAAATAEKPNAAEIGIASLKKSADKAVTAVKKAVSGDEPVKTAASDLPAKAAAPRWELRAATPGSAWLADPASDGPLRQVKVGDTVPGLGKIVAIDDESGDWVVKGSKRSVK